MRVSGYRLAMLRAPLRLPFKTALRQVDEVEDVVVLLESDCGKLGYGSAPATRAITGQDHQSIMTSLVRDLLPALDGRPFDDLGSVLALFDQLPKDNVNARSAIEIAVFDLAAQAAGVPLAAFLGGGSSLPDTGITVSVDQPEVMVAGALDALDRGFATLKLKVGGSGDGDIERVSQVAAAIAGRARIYLDANQAWTSDQAVGVIHALNKRGISIDLLEQPVPAGDIAGLARVCLALDTPVMADESVFCDEDAVSIIAAGAADIINIKLVKSAGITGALRVADIAADAGISCMMGCMLESAIAVGAAAHVAAARSAVIKRVDLDAPMLCRQNPIVGGTVFDGPRIELNSTPGLGIDTVPGLEFL